MSRPSVCIVGDDHDSVQQLKTWAVAQGFPMVGADGKNQDMIPLGQFSDRRTALVMIASSSHKGVELILHTRLKDRALPMIMVPTKSSEALAVAAFRAGATDYLPPPVTPTELLSCLSHWLIDHAMNDSKDKLAEVGELIGSSVTMQSIREYIKKVAFTDSNVLITGETGTGKDLVAELIYRNSSRKGKPFICLNCAAIPETLLESELFGYERGAFTGAISTQKGKFELAQGGTLFLDEIGEMGPVAQAKILRVIDTKQICRLGGQAGKELDVRLIAATNQPLKQLVQEEKFRKDLFFRLNVVAIHLPPLRERRQDIPELLNHFIQRLNQRWGRAVQGVRPDAMEAFIHYAWPGNVRELKNVLEGLFVEPGLCEIGRRDLPEGIQSTHIGAELSGPERERIMAVLNLTKWNKTWAAQQLHWSRMTLYRKLAKYQIHDDWRSDTALRTSQVENDAERKGFPVAR